MNIKRVTVGLLNENCYIIEKDNECLIIDPGDEFDKICKNIISKVIGVLLTHNHFDHVGALSEIVEKYNAPIYKFDNLNDKELSIGKFNLKVIFTPGHTSDSVTYYFKEEKIMFTGDFLFKENIGRTDLKTGNKLLMKESLEKIKRYDDDIAIYPGHGENSNLGYEKKNNIYLNN